jgi:flagellar FliJ protein
MKKFKFKLETVLGERKRIEDAKLRDWTLAQQIVLKMKSELADLERALATAVDEGGRLDSSSIGMYAAVDAFIKGTKIRIVWKKAEIERASKLLEKKRQEYVTARQRREALQKLKERKHAEYNDALKARELKELDDLYIMSRKTTEEEVA